MNDDTKTNAEGDNEQAKADEQPSAMGDTDGTAIKSDDLTELLSQLQKSNVETLAPIVEVMNKVMEYIAPKRQEDESPPTEKEKTLQSLLDEAKAETLSKQAIIDRMNVERIIRQAAKAAGFHNGENAVRLIDFDLIKDKEDKDLKDAIQKAVSNLAKNQTHLVKSPDALPEIRRGSPPPQPQRNRYLKTLNSATFPGAGKIQKLLGG
jgi:hypothetical protein